jgi:hypothetical protein
VKLRVTKDAQNGLNYVKTDPKLLKKKYIVAHGFPDITPRRKKEV